MIDQDRAIDPQDLAGIIRRAFEIKRSSPDWKPIWAILLELFTGSECLSVELSDRRYSRYVSRFRIGQFYVRVDARVIPGLGSRVYHTSTGAIGDGLLPTRKEAGSHLDLFRAAFEKLRAAWELMPEEMRAQ